jgi:tryptophan-rich sensory protein
MNVRTLLATSSATVAAALAGSLAMGGDLHWYDGLRKPRFQPPPLVFPVVWPALYADIAVTSALVLSELREAGRDDEADAYARALGINLSLNAGWTWVFFRAKRTGLATIESALLAVSSADLVRRAARVDRKYGAALAPYAGWTAFATVLAGAIDRLNRDR